MAEPTENRGETRRILGEMRSKIMHTQGPDGVHSVQYSTIGITNEADLIAATRRVQEHGEELIRQHREQIASIDDVTDSLAPDDHHRMLALLKAEEKRTTKPGADDFTTLQTLEIQRSALQTKLTGLQDQQANVQQELSNIYSGVDDLWNKLTQEGRTEDLQILEDRAAGKPLIVIDATVVGGAPGQSYVVYEEEDGERYINDPQNIGEKIYVKDLDEADRAQAVTDIENQKKFGQQFGNENPELAARFEAAEAKYQAHDTLRTELEQAIAAQNGDINNQFASIVESDKLDTQIAETQGQIDAIDTQIAAAQNGETEQLVLNRNLEQERLAKEAIKYAETAYGEIGNADIKAELEHILGREATTSEYNTFATKLEESLTTNSNAKLADDVFAKQETNAPKIAAPNNESEFAANTIQPTTATPKMG